MDALAALGLASNILSFVDFTWKLLAGANEIYASGAGVAGDVEFLDTITSDVQLHSRRIVAVPNATPELQSMAQQCDEIARELLKCLGELGIKGGKTRWSSFLAALKGVRSKKKVERLTDKISKVQARISAHLHELLLSNVSDLGRAIRELQMTHDELGIATTNVVSSLRREIQEVLKKLVDEESTIQMKQYFQQLQSQDLSPVVVAEMSYQMRTLANAMERLQEKGMQAGPSQRLLKKLHFTSISTRERKVTTAHADTFKWLDSPNEQTNQLSSCLDFIAWLNGGDGVFWIHGKPGSGKSTFMKFVCAQNSVREHLEHWAKDHQLVTPSFYFWYAGSRLQRSLEGLLRTLLYEILRRMTEVIPVIISDPELTVPVSYDEDWDLETLFRIYELVIQQPGKVKFCFFIDGLDEFHDEEHRSIRDLTSALHRLECSDKIKLCVASRPWTEFVDVYGHGPTKSLKLDDLTRNDIHAYVSGKFNSHEQFARLREIDSSYEGLISEVVDRAQGVFLWVRLVVQSLLEGFTFHDSARTLRQRLQSFPDDLSEFFDHIVTTIPAAYRGLAAHFLKAATAAEQPRLLIFYHFLDAIVQGEANEPNSIYAPLNPNSIPVQCEKMRRRLDGTSRGLLEVTMDETGTESASEGDADSLYFNLKVDFLHRTVRDFLVKSPKTLEFLNTHTGGDVDSSIALVKAAVAQLQFAEISVKDNQTSGRILDELFFYTRHAAIHVATQPEAAAALDGLLETAERVWNEILPGNVARTIDHIPVSFSGRAVQSGHTSFLKRKFASGLSVRAIEKSIDYSLYTDTSSWHSELETPKKFPNRWISSLVPFQRRAEKRPRQLSMQKPLLAYALTPLRNSVAPNADTVKLLLSKGASPNQAYAFHGTRVTVWESLIREFSSYSETPDWCRDESQQKRMFAIIRALLKKGAPFKDEVFGQTARETLERHFRPDQMKELTAVAVAARLRKVFGLL